MSEFAHMACIILSPVEHELSVQKLASRLCNSFKNYFVRKTKSPSDCVNDQHSTKVIENARFQAKSSAVRLRYFVRFMFLRRTSERIWNS